MFNLSLQSPLSSLACCYFGKFNKHSASNAIQVQLPSCLLSIAMGHSSVFGEVEQSSAYEITYMCWSQLAALYTADLRAVVLLQDGTLHSAFKLQRLHSIDQYMLMSVAGETNAIRVE